MCDRANSVSVLYEDCHLSLTEVVIGAIIRQVGPIDPKNPYSTDASENKKESF